MFSSIFDLFLSIMPLTLVYTSVLLLAALGGLVSERSGVVNIALEGIMIFGTFVFAYLMHLGVAPLLGLLISSVICGVYTLLHAILSVTFNANQTISGTALNLLAPALTIYLSKVLTGTGRISITSSFDRTTLDTLSDIPIIGDIFFTDAYITTLIAFIILIIVWIVVFKTSFGLRLRACGEHPQAADSVGINVYVIRYIAVLVSGLLAGLAGAIYVAIVPGEFTGSVQGYGFLALGALIFGKWRPFGVLLTTLFFAFMSTLGSVAQVNSVLQLLDLPSELYNVLPYVLTILALILFSRNNVGPKAAGEPYDKSKR